MHGLVRCKHDHRCSRARGVDVSFRYVMIKIPDRGYDQGCEWRHAPEAWAEILKKSVSWDWDLGEARRICTLRAPHVKGADGKVSIEWWYLSPYVEKPLNSKVIKSVFVFRYSYVLYIWFMNVLRTIMNMSISGFLIWLCNKRNNSSNIQLITAGGITGFIPFTRPLVWKWDYLSSNLSMIFISNRMN